MSKKLIYIRTIIIIICLIFIGAFVFLFNNIQKSTVVNERSIDKSLDEKVVFDMNLSPSKQKNLKGNVDEYFSQVYDYLYKDVRWKNIQESKPYTYSELKEKRDKENFYRMLKLWPYRNLFIILFNSDNEHIFKKIYLSYPLNMDDIPVTENYKKIHPKPLFDEFDIKKDDYDTKKKYDNNLETETWLHLNYEYGIGVNEEEKTVNIVETKNVEFLYEEDGEIRSRVVFDEKGNEMTESSIDTRQFTFKYTLDDKGYVDDVEFVDEIKLADDKYLDHLWGNVKG